MAEFNDKQLLLLLQGDPQRGLSVLLQQYGGLLNGIVRRVLPGAPQDAEECVADVLVAAWRSAAALNRQERSLKGWLCVTARNAAIDRWRALRRIRTEELPECLADEWLLEPHTSEAEDRVQALVLALSQPDREIFLRRYYLLQPSGEIARALGMTENTVNARLSRGRQRLRKQLLQAEKEGLSHA